MKVALLTNQENYKKYSNWNDVNWEIIHISTRPPDAEEIAATNADVLIVDAMTKIGPEIILNMPNLKLIHSKGVGFNAIDIETAKSAGIYVCNNAGINAYPVAEQGILLMLALLRELRLNEDMVYENRQAEAQARYFVNSLPELGSRKVGIVGFGAIGKALAALLKPFGCELFYFTRSGDAGLSDIRYLPLDKLYASCDIISLSMPVTPETENIINRDSLKLFKDGSILINLARGDLMDQQAVADALISGKLGGLGTDVLAPEPFLPDNPLLNLPENIRQRTVISPHIAGITEGTFIRSYKRMRKNIEAIENGQRPDCIVNGL